jgi:hypothetical protein
LVPEDWYQSETSHDSEANSPGEGIQPPPQLLRGSKTLGKPGKPGKPGKLGGGFNTNFAKMLQDLAICCNDTMESFKNPPPSKTKPCGD